MSANSLAGLSDEVGPLKPAADMAADQVLALRAALRASKSADDLRELRRALFGDDA